MRCTSVQEAADASQKLTVPVVTAVLPDFTVAVKVTTLPESTVVTAPLAEVIARVVVVAAGETAHACCTLPQAKSKIAIENDSRSGKERLRAPAKAQYAKDGRENISEDLQERQPD
jgi:hypothetical protein